MIEETTTATEPTGPIEPTGSGERNAGHASAGNLPLILAVTALVAGLFGLFWAGIILAPAALVLGFVSRDRGSRLGWAGIVLGLIGSASVAFYYAALWTEGWSF